MCRELRGGVIVAVQQMGLKGKGLIYSFSSAKRWQSKLLAHPTRVSTKRTFIVSSRMGLG